MRRLSLEKMAPAKVTTKKLSNKLKRKTFCRTQTMRRKDAAQVSQKKDEFETFQVLSSFQSLTQMALV